MPTPQLILSALARVVVIVGTILLSVDSASLAQEPVVRRLPTNLAEALLQLQTIDNGPTRQKTIKSVEFIGEQPKDSLFTLEACRSAAEYSAKMDGRAMLVILDGQPLFARYEPSWPRWKSHRLGQASGCIAGIVAACAVQDGLMTFDEPVSNTITEWADGSKRADVTIRQLLTMTSGIEPGDVSYVASYKEAIEAKLQSDPGTSFAFGTNALQVFGALLRRKLSPGKGDDDKLAYTNYLEKRVFKPLDIELGSWSKTTANEPNIATGAFLSAVDFAKLGALLCGEGMWGDKQIVEKETLLEILEGTDAHPGYGMGLWLAPKGADVEVSPETRMVMPSFGRTNIEGMYIATGDGRQRLYVLPREKTVVVRLGDPRINIFRDETFFRHLLPAKNGQ